MASVSSSAGLQTSQGLLQITGLASGLDTNNIINAMMQAERLPLTHLQTQQTNLQALNGILTGIQTALQGVSLNAQALRSPGLFANAQTVTSTNSVLVSATPTGSAGAVVGGYQVGVNSLASSAQRTFTFASPSSAASFTIDGQAVSLAAGATATDLVNAINSSPSYDVWATTLDSGTVVFSNRQTGNTGTGYIQVTDSTGTLTEQATKAKQGQDASFTVNGTAYTSATNTSTTAVPGVTLTLSGATGSTPVTVNVGAPAPSTSAVQSAVTTFVNSYNAALDQIQAQLTQTSSSSNPTHGQLFGDTELTDLQSQMRDTIYAPGGGLPAGMASLADIGITTGAANGTTFSQASVTGHLQVDATKLATAIQNNPQGVQNVLTAWSQSFTGIVDSEAQVGGTLDARITGDNSQLSDISNRIASMNDMLTTRQASLTAQFARLEATLSQSQTQSSWLASQINQLP